MKIIKDKILFDTAEYVLDNGTMVVLYLNLESWVYFPIIGDRNYICGTYEEEDNSIIDWGGCFELPEEVMLAFRHYGFNTSNIKTKHNR